ncbi:cyclin K [Dermatophagoides farinae]|uniref:cyclin K n=1 Tax=Dermatophagoides farinae TaxID=6954 RepID=UPI003F63D002
MTQMDSETIPGSASSSIMNNSSANSNQQSSSLIQQYNWYYDKSELKRTPSILDGISYEKERMYRNEGARFILNAGLQMKLRYDTLATGVVYFHRFYMRHSFKVFPRYVTAACCLFLAGKAEETPKKCKDIIKIARTLLDDNQFGTFGDDPKEEVLTLERIVLQTIRFDLQVEHPYRFLVSYAKCFKGNKDKIQGMLQMAWTFTNDSLCTTICLQWEPEIVAIAMIFLASKIRYEITDWEGRLPHQKHWWDIYVEDLSVELLEDICHQVLDLYSNSNEEPIRSPPQLSQPAGTQSSPSTPINMLQQPPSLPTGPPPTPVAATPVASLGQFRPIVNATAVAAVPQSIVQPNVTSIPTVANLTAPTQIAATGLPHHQWDTSMATFYNFPLAGTVHPVHMVPPPPPPPPLPHAMTAIGMPAMASNAVPPGRLPVIAPQPPIPPQFVTSAGINQHQPT